MKALPYIKFLKKKEKGSKDLKIQNQLLCKALSVKNQSLNYKTGVERNSTIPTQKGAMILLS